MSGDPAAYLEVAAIATRFLPEFDDASPQSHDATALRRPPPSGSREDGPWTGPTTVWRSGSTAGSSFPFLRYFFLKHWQDIQRDI